VLLRDAVPGLKVWADPDRFGAGMRALKGDGGIDVFVLDDGFQHRRVARDFDLVLISATEPFGFGHVHPRGLLREPIAGVRRADAVLMTRADEADSEAIEAIERDVRRHHGSVPIYRASHAHADVAGLAGKRVYAFCGIGEPGSFLRQVEREAVVVGSRVFGDHHAYGEQDLAELSAEARARGSEMMLTTGKDWVKVRGLKGVAELKVPIRVVEMAIRFREGDEQKLLQQIIEPITKAPTPTLPRSTGGGSDGN
jgi:tetraacyldisaccharide 4'-kinase